MTEEEYDLQLEEEWAEYQASEAIRQRDELLCMCLKMLEEIYKATDDEKRAELIYQAHEVCDELDIDSTWIPALNE